MLPIWVEFGDAGPSGLLAYRSGTSSVQRDPPGNEAAFGVKITLAKMENIILKGKRKIFILEGKFSSRTMHNLSENNGLSVGLSY